MYDYAYSLAYSSQVFDIYSYRILRKIYLKKWITLYGRIVYINVIEICSILLQTLDFEYLGFYLYIYFEPFIKRPKCYENLGLFMRLFVQ